MGVKTFHTRSGPADTAVRSRAGVVGRQCRVALCRVPGMGVGDQHRIDLGFGPAHSARGLEAADRQDLVPADEPVSRRHRFAVVEQGSVADDDRPATGISNDDLEPAARRPADELADSSDVVAHVVSYGGVDAQ